MPETAILELIAEDVTEQAWDELTCAMLDGEDMSPDTMSCNTFACGCVACDCLFCECL